VKVITFSAVCWKYFELPETGKFRDEIDVKRTTKNIGIPIHCQVFKWKNGN
jgi:hypothetical protein